MRRVCGRCSQVCREFWELVDDTRIRMISYLLIYKRSTKNGFDRSSAADTPLPLTTMSLRQDLLRSSATDTLDKQLSNVSISRSQPNADKDDSDDELINVVS